MCFDINFETVFRNLYKKWLIPYTESLKIKTVGLYSGSKLRTLKPKSAAREVYFSQRN